MIKLSFLFRKIASFVTVAILLSSCIKSNSKSAPQAYGVSFSNNGITCNYTLNASASFYKLNGGLSYVTLIAGDKKDSTTMIQINITSAWAYNTSTIYTDPSYQANILLFNMSTGTGLISYYAADPNVKVKFSSITSTYVEGTFSGNVAPTKPGIAQPITEGSFCLQVQ